MILQKTSSKIQFASFFSLAERPQALHSKGVTFIKLYQLELISLGKNVTVSHSCKCIYWATVQRQSLSPKEATSSMPKKKTHQKTPKQTNKQNSQKTKLLKAELGHLLSEELNGVGNAWECSPSGQEEPGSFLACKSHWRAVSLCIPGQETLPEIVGNLHVWAVSTCLILARGDYWDPVKHIHFFCHNLKTFRLLISETSVRQARGL